MPVLTRLQPGEVFSSRVAMPEHDDPGKECDQHEQGRRRVRHLAGTQRMVGASRAGAVFLETFVEL